MTLSETHHVHKKDAPSGTAKTMAEFAEKTSGKKIADIESIREGEVIGDHEITFETKEDILKISIVEYLSNHRSDHTQIIFEFRGPNQNGKVPESKTTFNKTSKKNN